MPVPKKRESKSKKNIRKNIWKRKAFNLRAFVKGELKLKEVEEKAKRR